MSVNNKHLATFLLGAAAAFGAYKYNKMTDEEKEELSNKLKDKANKLKDSALDAEDKAMEYFNELKTKGADAFKDYMPKVEEFFENLFGKDKGEAQPAAAASGAAPASSSGASTPQGPVSGNVGE
ncbi:YtxH domain-containing protein [Flaviaesturariibacter amylovorans]|uniref:YtxH domain-containing protein n=1 Tax=Flaviaesturariibacter amylovorans TaxID=1084520 RepID=A0ABP8GAM1_9BACT